VSERRICRVLGQHRSTQRKVPRGADDEQALSEDIIALAKQYGRYGYRDNVPATDPSGYAGLADKVDFHTWTLLKGVAISTLLGVGANVTFSGESDLVQAIRQSTQQNVARAGDQITFRNLQIQPTITIRPGPRVLLVVHRDLILAPWKQ
jgi:hypothetical protein